jgi:hypothetical protein
VGGGGETLRTIWSVFLVLASVLALAVAAAFRAVAVALELMSAPGLYNPYLRLGTLEGAEKGVFFRGVDKSGGQSGLVGCGGAGLVWAQASRRAMRVRL